MNPASMSPVSTSTVSMSTVQTAGEHARSSFDAGSRR